MGLELGDRVREGDLQTLRLFTAIPLDPPAVKRLAEVRESLESDSLSIRWIPPQNLHLTLHFLGPTPSNLLEDLHHDLGAAANRHRPFDLALGGLGCFPDTKKPRVLWAGLKDTHGHLASLESDCRQVLDRYRLFKLEEHYVPHVTLGRLNPARAFDHRLLEAVLPQWPDLGRLPVEKMILFKSVLGAGGTLHEVLQEYFLRA